MTLRQPDGVEGWAELGISLVTADGEHINPGDYMSVTDYQPHPDAERLRMRDAVQGAGERVYAGFGFPETDALLDALEDAGWKVVPA